MRFATIGAALLSAPWAAASGSQEPLSPLPQHHGDSADAPPYRAELLDLHRSLVSIPSTTGAENGVGNFLVDYLTERGYAADIQFIPPMENTPEGQDRFNVVAWRGGDVPKPKVLVTSHIDVVPPHIPYAIDDEGDDVTAATMIRGRGSVDAKGSVAAMIVALGELLGADAIDGEDVMLLFVVGEERSGDGMRLFSDSLARMEPPPSFTAAVFGEPTENRLACGHKGGIFCDVKARGVGGHSGYPWLGKSANELMVRAMARVLEADLGSSEDYGNTTVNIGVLQGGVAPNVIPEHAIANLVVRVAIGPEAGGGEVVQQRIKDILEELDDEAFDFECTPGYGFVECNCDVDGFDTIVVNYGTDIPHLKGNHTRYLYGPGTILVAHGDHENLTVGDLETSVEGYQQLILHALKQ